MSHRRQYGNQKSAIRLAAMRRIAGPRNSQLATRNSPPDRRGILLLVVLSMLVLFLLVGTSFIVSSNQYRKASKTLGKPYAPAKSPLQHTDLLEEVVNQLVRDTNNEFSSLRYHSLLRDLYGADGFTFELPDLNVSFAPNTGGQFIRIDIQFSTPPPLSQINGYYNGLVWTMADGAASGESVRIVNYRYLPASDTYRFELMRPENFSGLPQDFAAGGDRVVLNGRPFNGTGVGYNPNVSGTARLGALESVTLTTGAILDEPIALMPNAAFFDPNNVFTSDYFVDPNSRELSYVGRGGSDESYDAPDFQNMALAWSPVSPVETVLFNLADPLPLSLGKVVLPSFHRPALINYWYKIFESLSGVELASEPSMLRKIMLRPNWFDHPNFTGSNPEYADAVARSKKLPKGPLLRMIYGPWDVDNDNDGRRDSVWVDFGAPVMMGSQGKLVKPLAAILCLDLDGRLNLNAHGTLEHLNPPNFDADGNPDLAGNVSSDLLPHGQGYGPAEISLERVVGELYQRILQGVRANNPFDLDAQGNPFDRAWSGRYGHSLTGFARPTPGFVDSYDLLAQLKQQGLPQWANELGNYATPPDLKGRYSVGLNDLGQPVYEAAFDTTEELDQDSPYELDLSRVGPHAAGDSAKDGPFSLAEMERILRAYDRDAGKLPARLWVLANRFRTASGLTDIDELNEWRALLTTDSFDLPVPSVVLPEWMRNGIPGQPGTGFFAVMGRQPVNLSFADLLEYRLRLGGVPDRDSDGSIEDDIRRELGKMLAPELADGLRLDLNRPFGNGRDDDGNGVVDEPGEIEGAYWQVDGTRAGAKEAVGSTGSFTDPATGAFRDNFDRNGDGAIDASDGFATAVERDNFRRQLFARHLYVLAMTLVDPVPIPAGGVTDLKYVENSRKQARQLAQWAINVADFRDPDNIMTAFEYDANPFDGWQVDGDLSTPLDIYGGDGKFGGTGANADPGGLVWGAERPELVITETLAWHDRRTRDSRFEGEASTLELDNQKVEDVTTGDLSADQQQRPQGAAFIELYNPWPAETAANADTHFVDGSGNDLGVNLSALDVQTGTSPVWRIMVYRDGGVDKNPDALDMNDRPGNFVRRDKKADRSVYFSGYDPNYPDDGVAFFNDGITNLVESVRPGRYMVIGSGIESNLSTGKPQLGTGEYLAKFGENNSQSSQRGIVLRPDRNASGPAVELRGFDGITVRDAAGFDVEAPAEGSIPGVPPMPGFNSMTSVALIDRAEPTAVLRRFTFTEPPGGYPRSVTVVGGKAFSNSTFQENEGDNGEYVPILDIPLDDVLSRQFQPKVNLGQRRIRSPINDGELRLGLPEEDQGPRTIPGFNWIYLQRLANPLMPWNPAPGELGHVLNQAVNPYMTIDSMGVNVTVFNGLSDAERRARPGTSPLRFSNNYSLQTFASNQRGRLNDPTQNVQDFARLQQRVQLGKSIPLQDPDAAALTNPFKNNIWTTEPIDASSYWMNKGGQFGNGTDNAPGHFLGGVPDCTLGFMNEPFRGTGPGALRDVPETPFPWIAWNNRPYVSAGELLQVPRHSTAELPRAFGFVSVASQTERYDRDPNQVTSGSSDDFELDGPFPHLMNFFRTKMGDGKDNTPNTVDDEGIAGLYRVLDYVGVPSRYVGTETWLNPAEFGSADVITTEDPRYLRQPPFNKISAYRDPGRVNINTIGAGGTGRVWHGMFHGSSKYAGVPNNLDTFAAIDDDRFFSVRRGYGTFGDEVSLLDPSIPTLFANPFRSSGTGDLVPIANMMRSEVETTMMRSMGTPPFVDASVVPTGQPQGVPLLSAGATEPHRNAFRNAYFRYDPLKRLSSMATTRSNVYAVWITVGFFEVEEAPNRDAFANSNGFGATATPQSDAIYNRVYPEGYQLGREMGSDTGEFERLREFVIVDRSIPVAFEPGEDHNTERAVRLRRRIE